MNHFLTFRSPKGELLLIRSEMIWAVIPGTVHTPPADLERVSILLVAGQTIPVRESAEVIEAMLKEEKFT